MQSRVSGDQPAAGGTRWAMALNTSCEDLRLERVARALHQVLPLMRQRP